MNRPMIHRRRSSVTKLKLYAGQPIFNDGRVCVVRQAERFWSQPDWEVETLCGDKLRRISPIAADEPPNCFLCIDGIDRLRAS